MTTVCLASLIALVVVFLTATVGKLASPGSARRATAQLGGPMWGAPFLVPAEVGVVALLLVRPAFGTLAAGLLLGGFTVVLVRVVRSGQTVSCGCFGSATSASVSGATVARNLGLMSLCVPAAFAPRIISVAGDTLAAAVVVAAGVISGGLLVSALLQIRSTTGSIFALSPRTEV
jgi:hypothetical protein